MKGLSSKIKVKKRKTFKKSNELQNTFKNIPLENLLIETDSPYLAPDPHRGKINEPSLIIHTLKKLSDLKNLGIKDLETITSNNFNKLDQMLSKSFN